MNYSQKKVVKVRAEYDMVDIHTLLKEGWDLYGHPQYIGEEFGLIYTLVKYEHGIWVSGKDHKYLMETAYNYEELDK